MSKKSKEKHINHEEKRRSGYFCMNNQISKGENVLRDKFPFCCHNPIELLVLRPQWHCFLFRWNESCEAKIYSVNKTSYFPSPAFAALMIPHKSNIIHVSSLHQQLLRWPPETLAITSRALCCMIISDSQVTARQTKLEQ